MVALPTWRRTEGGEVILWNVAAGKEIRRVRAGIAHASSPDGKTLATGQRDGTVVVWDSSGRELRRLKGEDRPVTVLGFSPDGKVLASGHARVVFRDDGPGAGKNDCAVRLWDVASGKELHRLAGHGAAVTAALFSPDGRLLATAGSDSATF